MNPGTRIVFSLAGAFVVLIIIALAFILSSCSSHKDTTLPRELEKIDSIKSSMEKLSVEERELLAGYIMRHTMGAKLGGLFGGKQASGIPEGMTLGKAIEEQRKFKTDALLEEAKQNVLKENLAAAKEEQLKSMREAVKVELVSKKLRTNYGFGGVASDELLDISFVFKNNTPKEISGVKGEILVQDLFGDKLFVFRIANDSTIKSGHYSTWHDSLSTTRSFGNNKNYRKFADLPDNKYTLVWIPNMVIFSDGTKLATPSN